MPSLNELQDRTIALLESQIKRAELRDKELAKYDEALAQMIANLSRAMVTLLAEARKREAHVRRSYESYSPEERDALVLAYTNLMTRERRALLRKQLDELDSLDPIA